MLEFEFKEDGRNGRVSDWLRVFVSMTTFSNKFRSLIKQHGLYRVSQQDTDCSGGLSRVGSDSLKVTA